MYRIKYDIMFSFPNLLGESFTGLSYNSIVEIGSEFDSALAVYVDPKLEQTP